MYSTRWLLWTLHLFPLKIPVSMAADVELWNHPISFRFKDVSCEISHLSKWSTQMKMSCFASE